MKYCNKQLLFFDYSQVQPSETNHAVNMLSETIKQRNIKKVKVNAQITFWIWILETVANYSTLVVWSFAHRNTVDLTFIFIVLWYHIIISYTFLMNTSHNKNLLIDDGWANTIRNTLKLPEFANVISFDQINEFLQSCKRSRSNQIAPIVDVMPMNQTVKPKEEERQRNLKF